jgi:hypothetical protein
VPSTDDLQSDRMDISSGWRAGRRRSHPPESTRQQRERNYPTGQTFCSGFFVTFDAAISSLSACTSRSSLTFLWLSLYHRSTPLFLFLFRAFS